MPEVFRTEGYAVFFYTNEGHEPIQVHVRKAGASAEFSIDPVALEYSQGMKTRELSRAEKLIRENLELIRRRWNEVFHP